MAEYSYVSNVSYAFTSAERMSVGHWYNKTNEVWKLETACSYPGEILFLAQKNNRGLLTMLNYSISDDRSGTNNIQHELS